VLSGTYVSLYGGGVIYNYPAYNPATDSVPSAITICYDQPLNLERISGFFSVGQGLTPTELILSDWSSAYSNPTGWPAEPACA
jgi:hypothetical protein